MKFTVLCALVSAAAYGGLAVLHQLDPNDEWSGLEPHSIAFVLSLMPLYALLSQGALLDRVRHGALFRKLPPRGS